MAKPGSVALIPGGVMRRVANVLCALVLVPMSVVALEEGPSQRADAAGPTLPPGFTLVDTATGQAAFNLTDYTWLPDGALLTSGKDGTVTFVPPGGSPRVIGHVPGVRANGDHGMLGFAAANDYATTGRVYITYDEGDPNGTGFGMVEEWNASPAASPTTFTKVRTLIDGSAMTPALAQTTINHGVDEVIVRPDGTLFVSVGDDAMNNGGPNSLRAQDVDLPYGKILHLTADGDGVSTNPFYDAAAPHSWRSMVYAYGFRNPFRFSIDARNGLLQLGDVGWNQTEEVDTVAAGMNGGWPCYEGTRHPDAFKTQQACLSLYAAGTATPPIVTYEHAGSGASVTGGVQYNGASYPMAYRGAWFYGDYARGMLWTLTTDDAGHLQRAPETAGFGSNIGGPVAFQPGPGGDITYADISTGNVRRLVYATGNHAPSADIDFQVNPDTRTVSFSAAGSSDPDGDALTYDWNFGDGTSSTQAAPQHTFGDGAERTVTLTVRDVMGATGTTTALVNPGGHSPTLTLTLPTKQTFAVGDQVKLSAKATDPEDGDLVVHWTSALKHCPFTNSCHLHPEGAADRCDVHRHLPRPHLRHHAAGDCHGHRLRRFEHHQDLRGPADAAHREGLLARGGGDQRHDRHLRPGRAELAGAAERAGLVDVPGVQELERRRRGKPCVHDAGTQPQPDRHLPDRDRRPLRRARRRDVVPRRRQECGVQHPGHHRPRQAVRRRAALLGADVGHALPHGSGAHGLHGWRRHGRLRAADNRQHRGNGRRLRALHR